MGDHFKTGIDQLAAFTKDLDGANESLEQVRTALQHVRSDQIGTMPARCTGLSPEARRRARAIGARVAD
ncbi:hypothetical protein AB0C70_31320 [Streptomyces sp. NPDC048564]|uniref:hypothetical protein n=1 Tax=Streptomyces sp. NPDC048564 TaxID=3155760 RepID=UPI00342A6880